MSRFKITRRLFLASAAAVAVSSLPGLAHDRSSRHAAETDLDIQPQIIPFDGFEPDTIVVDAKNHALYWVLPDGQAKRYTIGVGKAGRGLKGTVTVGRKAEWPSWRPTDNMIRREPRKYARYARGLPGGPKNPLGARALYLYRDDRDTMFRIHGTNEPWTIGQSVSNGCIRLLNDHVIDLYNRVEIGSPVVFL